MNDLNRRRINPDWDREILLALHCTANYESDCAWSRSIPYEVYERDWLVTPQPEMFLEALRQSLDEPRTIAEFWCAERGRVVGYVWATFIDVEGYDLVLCELRDIVVAADWRRKGLASQILETVEHSARDHGADLLRSETGVENTASQRLHEKAGFAPYHILYEKPLSDKCRLEGA